jgi:AraC-like DNA-binding protein/mannose-6-phosphate isomerase-like protein (cupin superfamily)
MLPWLSRGFKVERSDHMNFPDRPMRVTDLSLRSYRDTALTHSHDHYQIVLALTGTLEMEVSGRIGRAETTSMVAVAPGRPHSFRASGANRFLVIDWQADSDETQEAERLMSACDRQPFLRLDQRLLPLLRFLENACTDAGIEAEERKDWGRLLLTRLGAGIERRSSVLTRRLDRALAFMEARKSQPLTVSEIAKAAHTSAGHLHALFQRDLGRTPMQHLAGIRLDHAVKLLGESDLSIASVAAAAGYGDQSALTRALRRRRGITPARYRQSQRRDRRS